LIATVEDPEAIRAILAAASREEAGGRAVIGGAPAERAPGVTDNSPAGGAV
jgi:hypothetical protein